MSFTDQRTAFEDPKGKLLSEMSNPKANSYLKETAGQMKLSKRLTFHCARHTFTTRAMLTNGVPMETVGQMLGHNKLATTQLYARVTDTKVEVVTQPRKANSPGKNCF